MLFDNVFKDHKSPGPVEFIVFTQIKSLFDDFTKNGMVNDGLKILLGYFMRVKTIIIKTLPHRSKTARAAYSQFATQLYLVKTNFIADLGEQKTDMKEFSNSSLMDAYRKYSLHADSASSNFRLVDSKDIKVDANGSSTQLIPAPDDKTPFELIPYYFP